MSIMRFELKDGGTNFGNALMQGMRTGSALKSAKMMREKQQREFDKEDAGTKLRENSFAEAENEAIEAENEAVDESEQGGGDGGYIKDTKPTLSTDEVNKLKALAPKVDKELTLTAQQKKFKEGMKKRFMMRGMSSEEADALSNGSITQIKDMETWVKTANENDKVEKASIINDVNKQVMNVMSLPAEEQPKAYAKAIDTLDADMQIAIDNGNTKQVKILSDIKKQMPKQFSKEWASDFIMTETQKFEILKENLQTKNNMKEETHKATKNAPKVITVGNEDISYKPDPKTGVYKEDKKATSNSLLKVNAKNKGTGAYKSADWSLLHRQAIAQETGLDIDDPNLVKNYSKLARSKRVAINQLEARASQIAKDSGGALTMAQALEQATKEDGKKKRDNTPIKEGATGVNKNKEPVKYINGKWIVQK